MTPEQIADWIPIVNTAGVIVFLVVLVGAIVKGWLWPKHMVDRTLEEQRKAGQIAAKQIGEDLSLSMEDGIGRILRELESR